jgi:ATP-dependent exoDNAse (exonuclease V) beta subunit
VIGDLDAAVRLRAFDFPSDQRRRFGEASIPRAVLEQGFHFDGVRVPLIGPQGIFKPAILPEVPLSITTAPPVENRDRRQEIYDTERHLLYVACTRARDHLVVTGVVPASEFLGDLLTSGSACAGSRSA